MARRRHSLGVVCQPLMAGREINVDHLEILLAANGWPTHPHIAGSSGLSNIHGAGSSGVPTVIFQACMSTVHDLGDKINALRAAIIFQTYKSTSHNTWIIRNGNLWGLPLPVNAPM